MGTTLTDTPQHYTLAGAAAAYAVRAHNGQVRMGTQFPYVVHPLGVGQILREFYPDRDDLEAAGYLHDVVEDTARTILDIEDRFGFYVAYLVNAVTRKRGWRLEDYASNKDVMRLKDADVIDNVLDTIRGVEKGHDVWSRFSAGRRKIDYWIDLEEMISACLPDEPILMRLTAVMMKVDRLAQE